MDKVTCGIEFQECPHCGAVAGGDEVIHIYDSKDPNDEEVYLLCGGRADDYIDDGPEEYEIKYLRGLNSVCPTCKRKLDVLIEAKKAGFDSVDQYQSQMELDKRRYAYWMKHGSLVGFK